MYNNDRKEAGVFLIGLLLTCGDNWEKRRAIATALYDVQNEVCVNVLFGELKRVKNINSTRRYLNEVIDVLSCMPPPLVLPGLEELVLKQAKNPAFSARLKSADGDGGSPRPSCEKVRASVWGSASSPRFLIC